MNTTTIVNKVWSYCNVLRDDGVSYGDYLEQITYLLFLKMADEYSRPPYNREIDIPKEYDWDSLKTKRGSELESHYISLLRALGKQKGMLGQIFVKSQNKIQDPSKLFQIIDMIDHEQWVMMGADVKGDIYEGLLEKNAEDTKSGAGQYYTPRKVLVKSKLKLSTETSTPELTVEGAIKGAVEGAVEGVTEGVKNKLIKLLILIYVHEGNRVPFYAKEMDIPDKTIEGYIKRLRDAKLIKFSKDKAPHIGGYFLEDELKRKIKNEYNYNSK